MSEKQTSRTAANDLPVAGNITKSNAANGLMAAAEPVDFLELKAALLKHPGGKIKHAGGALPPLFSEKGIREGDARLVNWLGFEIVTAERAGGGQAFLVLNFDVLDHHKPAAPPVLYRAQMPLTATLEKYFGCEELGEIDDKHPVFKGLGGAEKALASVGSDEEFVIPTRDPEATPMLIITYAGQMAAKKQGFAGAKRWIIEEYTPAKA